MKNCKGSILVEGKSYSETLTGTDDCAAGIRGDVLRCHTMARIVILISGRGSNMEAIIRGARSYEVIAVISNKTDAPGLVTAADLGVRSIAEPSITGIASLLDEMNPDLVCMAGFMKILPGDVVRRHKTMNVHPSLLPKYAGLHAIRQALRDGAKWTGCTIHFADSGVDTGKIIAQDAVPIACDDTEETLSARVLEREHELYAMAVEWYCGKMQVV